MFNLFQNKEVKCPVDEEMRGWIEYAMQWLMLEFGEEFFHEVAVYSNMKELLNAFDKETATLDELGEIVSYIMFLDEEDIIYTVYDEGENRIETGTGFFPVNAVEGEVTTGGMYVGKNEDSKYDVGIERKVLQNPVHLVSTIAHELSHVWLLGKKEMDVNDEYLTDMLPIIFGLGVFGASSCFSFSQSNSGWATQTKGYFNQMEWGYALAVYSWLRKDKNPEWVKSLPRNILSDYKQSLKFMENNQDKLFQQEV
ncbi:MAG: hypothetical protein COB15_06640 [Flavobacteriales bacterium]|nr:MAG: hypothetical protein COB15_06640 [Flavobacteriales bacterium]